MTQGGQPLSLSLKTFCGYIDPIEPGLRTYPLPPWLFLLVLKLKLFDGSREAFTFAGAGCIDNITQYKLADIDLVTDL